MIDYRNLRLNNINSPQYKHLLLLIFWPVYGLVFWLLERGIKLSYNVIECSFDNKIPFCEYFVFPYYLWFGFLAFIFIFTLLFDVEAFKKLMYFVIITYTVTTIIYIVYPNMQMLRPTEFARDNFCVTIVKNLYSFDTNTNVCPSLHVVGSFAVLFTVFECKKLRTPLLITVFTVLTILISISTVFLKQHSIIDIWVALILCAVAYPFAYIIPKIAEKKIKVKKVAVTPTQN